MLIATSSWFVEVLVRPAAVPARLLAAVKLIRLNKTGALRRSTGSRSGYPSSGTIVEKTIVARTMRTLGTLVGSGVPILEALSIVRETATTPSSSGCSPRVYESIREGDTIAEPLKESRLVDDMVVNMVEVGEETGDLDTMLYKIADFYDEEVDVLVESADQPAGADHDRGPRRHHRRHRDRAVPAADQADQQALGLSRSRARREPSRVDRGGRPPRRPTPVRRRPVPRAATPVAGGVPRVAPSDRSATPIRPRTPIDPTDRPPRRPDR